jgi:hypothetical protein
MTKKNLIEKEKNAKISITLLSEINIRCENENEKGICVDSFCNI